MATERKAAIVTGAASGLGRAMALGLVESGMDVVAVDRNATALAAMVLATGGTPGSVLSLLWHRLLGGQRPSLGDYVMGMGPTDEAPTPPEGASVGYPH